MDSPFNSTLESDIKELMKEVPPPIKAFFASGKVEIVAKNLMQKYRLHIDQGAITEREIILLLLGLKDPTEFTKSLVEEAKLDQQTVNSITKDVNEQIFVPLREEMRKGPAPQVAPTPPTATQGTAQEKVMPLNTVIIPSNPQMPVRSPQILAPTLKYAPPVKSIEFQSKIPPPTSKPMDNNKLLEDHEEPHIEFKKAPPNLPGALPPIVPPAPKPVIPIPPQIPIIKEYSSDPYREPIDEK